MSTKSKAKKRLEDKKKEKEKEMDPTEKKVKEFIDDMIKYYKNQRKTEDEKEAKAFTYNILTTSYEVIKNISQLKQVRISRSILRI